MKSGKGIWCGMKAYKIDDFIFKSEDQHFITKFGGQPDWMESPQWPVSPVWDDRPLKFVGQIRLNDFYELEKVSLAYIFMTQPEDRNDSFFDPDIIYPDGGENAVIIQPDGKMREYIHVENLRTGPTVDSKNIWIPRTTEIMEIPTTEWKQLEEDKFCGIPAFVQNSEAGSDSQLLLQLHTNWLPFYINAGGSPTIFAFINNTYDEGFILIEDM